MSDDATTALNAPVVENGLERIPFFNGRVLTAEDLKTEQEANATERHRLGSALGSGVLEGLFVRLGDTPTTVTVEAGQALAPSGRVLELPREVTLSVISELDSSLSAGTEGTFEACSTQDTVVTSGSGAYLLVAEPAAEPRGRVPRTGLQGDGAAGECGAKFRKMGARLCLVHIDTEAGDLVPRSLREPIRTKRGTIEGTLVEGEEPDPADVSKLRNLLAHMCLGTPEALTEAASLYDTLRDVAKGGDPGPAVALDRLRRNEDLSEDAVPLALLYWAQDTLLFVDNWSVRRRVHRTDPKRPVPATGRRRAETEAAIYQFQDHLADLIEKTTPGKIKTFDVSNYVRYLPPVGTVPVTDFGATKGVDYDAFFASCAIRDPIPHEERESEDRREAQYVEGRCIGALFHEAGLHPPIDLQTKTLIRLYWVRENMQAAKRGDAQPTLLFASGYLPDVSEARFNLSHWGYARFRGTRGC